jgi:hypothetical protein
MQHSVFKIFFHTLLLVLVNSIQGCGGHNIDLREPTGIAPEEQAAPANNPTPNNEEKTTMPNAQKSEASTTASASGTTHNDGSIAFVKAPTTCQAGNVTRNRTNTTATINVTEKDTLSTTSSITSASSSSQASIEHTNPSNTARQQELKSLLDELPKQIQANINNYLTPGRNATALDSLQHSGELLEAGTINHSQLKILWNAISIGAKQYVENFNVTNKSVSTQNSGNYYRIQDETSKRLEQIESMIEQINGLQ